MSETIEPFVINARHLDGSTKNGGDGALYLNYNQQDKPIYMNGGNTAIHSGNIGTYLANKLTIEDAPQNTDMNTITSSKIVGITYTEGTNQTNLHTPLGETTSGYSTVSYYNVETISFAGGYRLCQVAWSCFSHNSGMWYRTKHDANWSAWKKILTEVDLSTIDTNQTGDIVYSAEKPAGSYLLCKGQTIESSQYPALVDKVKYQFPSEFSVKSTTISVGDFGTSYLSSIWWEEVGAFIIACRKNDTNGSVQLYKYIPSTNQISLFASVVAGDSNAWIQQEMPVLSITSSGHLCMLMPRTYSDSYYYTAVIIFNSVGTIVYKSVLDCGRIDPDHFYIFYNPSNNYIYGVTGGALVFYASNGLYKSDFSFSDNINVYGDTSVCITPSCVMVSDTYKYSDGSLRKYYLRKYVFGLGQTDLSESAPMSYMKFFGAYNTNEVLLVAQTMVPSKIGASDTYRDRYPTYDRYFYLYDTTTNSILSTIPVSFSVNSYNINLILNPNNMPYITADQLYGITNSAIASPTGTYQFSPPMSSISKDRRYGITMSAASQVLTVQCYDFLSATKTTLPLIISGDFPAFIKT